MKSEEEIERYIRCMRKYINEIGLHIEQVCSLAAIGAAEWVLGNRPDPPGYAELLAQDKADDKRMDQ